MKELLAKIKWVFAKKPVITYNGFNCGCCGKWVKFKFSIPTYKSLGAWWDTWGICANCEIAE